LPQARQTRRKYAKETWNGDAFPAGDSAAVQLPLLAVQPVMFAVAIVGVGGFLFIRHGILARLIQMKIRVNMYAPVYVLYK
jgi:hypothetical protein